MKFKNHLTLNFTLMAILFMFIAYYSQMDLVFYNVFLIFILISYAELLYLLREKNML